jgi:hypothetical protein
METRVCAAADCKKDFAPKFHWEKFCSSRCKTRTHVRLYRARRRKGGGGGGNGGGNGGGEGTFVDTITPVDSRAIYAPDTSYRTPEVPRRNRVSDSAIAEPACAA